MGQEGPKRSSIEGSRNGSEKVIKKGYQNESFWEGKNIKKCCKVVENQGFEGFGKVSKNDRKRVPKLIPKVSKMEPLAALGRARGDFVPPLGRFEGSRKSVDF